MMDISTFVGGAIFGVVVICLGMLIGKEFSCGCEDKEEDDDGE